MGLMPLSQPKHSTAVDGVLVLFCTLSGVIHICVLNRCLLLLLYGVQRAKLKPLSQPIHSPEVNAVFNAFVQLSVWKVYDLVCLSDDIELLHAPLRSSRLMKTSTRAAAKSISQPKHSETVDGVFNLYARGCRPNRIRVVLAAMDI